jgi:hypothetical protein
MTDAEIFDAIGVPEDRRAELQRSLRAAARNTLPGPNRYALLALLLWRWMQLPPPLLGDDIFYPSGWKTSSTWSGHLHPDAITED